MSLTYHPSQQQQKSSGILGTLGTLATLGGMAFGVPWLGAIGTGMKAADTLMNGNSSYSDQAQATGNLGEVLNGVLGGLGLRKLSDNNIAKSAEEQAKEAAGRIVNGGNSKEIDWNIATHCFGNNPLYSTSYYTTPGWINSNGWRY